MITAEDVIKKHEELMQVNEDIIRQQKKIIDTQDEVIQKLKEMIETITGISFNKLPKQL